jgi:3-oxo-5-alpha-steroid 4-dehydrogenase 1
MFNYVTSANYFGELIEWLGFAILTWSVSGLVFFIWTFANLVPRANAIYKRYKQEFPEEMQRKKLKRVIPFVY